MKVVLSFLKKYWYYVAALLVVVLFILPAGKKWIAKIKLWTGIGDYKGIGEPDYHLLSLRVFDALHGSKLTEREPEVILIVNSLENKEQYSKLSYQYAKDNNLDLRNDIIKYFNKKQYSKLKYQ